MDNELEVIRHQMEEKRASLADKLDALENQVIGKVQDTTAEVTNIVHEVKESVTEVVQGVKSTVDSVTEGVQDTVESVKDTFDFREHIRRNPWLGGRGAVAAGFAGRLSAALFPTHPDVVVATVPGRIRGKADALLAVGPVGPPAGADALSAGAGSAAG